MARLVVDPITRIEGHLRIEAVVENGAITDAYSSGTMVRGFEKILRGRDPRDAWAFTERACGVCTTVHALASVRTVEDALGISVPKNAELIRNLMLCTQYVQDHVVHFYHLHALDWVDVVSSLSADPQKTAQIATSISSWPKSSPKYFAAVQQKLKAFVETGQLGIFAYWGNPSYKLPPEVNLLAVAHYLEALEWQKEIVKIHTIFGGKNPHPNYLVGGVPCSINPDEVNAINMDRLNYVGSLINGAIAFVEQVYYSWLKTPRWKDHAIEVGPLARLLVSYAKGSTEVKDVVDEALGQLGVPVTALFSTLGRTAARGLETRLVVHWMKGFYDELIAQIKTGELSTFTRDRWEPSTWPATAQGVGLSEAPRGALAHWIKIKDGKIDNYQLVVPTTWNASPRDPKGQRSAYEESLIGTRLANPEQPLEILRTIHSFDPCIACAVHLYDPDGKHVHQIKFY